MTLQICPVVTYGNGIHLWYMYPIISFSYMYLWLNIPTFSINGGASQLQIRLKEGVIRLQVSQQDWNKKPNPISKILVFSKPFPRCFTTLQNELVRLVHQRAMNLSPSHPPIHRSPRFWIQDAPSNPTKIHEIRKCDLHHIHIYIYIYTYMS